jgi:hypothetical protein
MPKVDYKSQNPICNNFVSNNTLPTYPPIHTGAYQLLCMLLIGRFVAPETPYLEDEEVEKFPDLEGDISIFVDELRYLGWPIKEWNMTMSVEGLPQFFELHSIIAAVADKLTINEDCVLGYFIDESFVAPRYCEAKGAA